MGKYHDSWVEYEIFSDGSQSKFAWIKCERDFTFYHLRYKLNPWKTIFPILSEKSQVFALFYVKWLKLRELG